MLKLGIIGLPNAGKSTIFNLLTRGHAATNVYPFTTIEPNIGAVTVPDETLEKLAALLNPEKIIPAHIEFVDIAGLVENAHRGEGLGNQFLSHIRNVDALVHVVRCFSSGEVAHTAPPNKPLEHVQIIHTELLLADLQLLERHVAKLGKSHDRESRQQAAELEPLLKALEDGKHLYTLELSPALRRLAFNLGLLTIRPELFVANLGEGPPEEQTCAAELDQYARARKLACLPIHGKLEHEILEIPPEERGDFMSALGLTETAAPRLIRSGFQILDLITFYTNENNILQAWPLPRGRLAPEAAGLIHSDMQKGFISAEVVTADDLLRTGSFAEARHKGCLRQEGKHYEIKDRDVCRFLFA